MVEQVLDALVMASQPGGIVVLSGSNPPGVPLDFASRIWSGVAGTNARMIVDTSGAPLRYLAEYPCGLDILRMDSAEAEGLAGRPLPQRADTADFARALVFSGVARTVIVARGADGSTLVTEDHALHCSRPVKEIVSAVGAGDSFVGAFCLALSRVADWAEALRFGTAAAGAAVLTEATQLCTREDAERLLLDVELTKL